MEEDHSTPSSLWCSYSCCNGSKAAAIAALSFLSALLHTLTFSLTHSHKTCLFYRQFLATFSSNSKGTIGPEIMPLIVALVVLPLSQN